MSVGLSGPVISVGVAILFSLLYLYRTSILPGNIRAKASSSKQDEQLRVYKELFFQLHNLETTPDVLPRARERLLSLLCDSMAAEGQRITHGDYRSILSIEKYDIKALDAFIRGEHADMLERWQRYLASQAGAKGCTPFATYEDAVQWLRTKAPSKYVDGAWLGNVHRLTETTPFALRSVTKDAWQILSEELGDGDVERKHVFVYRKLLRSVGVDLPAADSREFVDLDLGMSVMSAWRAAVAQLLISLFSHDFLPEVLGFNLCFEQVTLETLRAAHELPKLGISGYYFLLHVCIDNIDSGHSAMALCVVSRYLDVIRESGGEGDMGRDEGDGGAVLPPLHHISERQDRVMRMLQRKAQVSSAIHCKSRVKIADRPLAAWLSSRALDNPQNQVSLLDGLSKASPWVQSGDSSARLLIRELSWGGKMFGAFTDTEVEHLKDWIDSLPPKGGEDATEKYWHMIGNPGQPVQHSEASLVSQDHDLQLSYLIPYQLTSPTFIPRPPLSVTGSNVRFGSLLTLWFAHVCLLQGMVRVPYRTISPLASHIVRILRAESGFGPEPTGVAGKDEYRNVQLSLVDLGLELAQRHSDQEMADKHGSLGSLPPRCLRDVLGEDNSRNDPKNAGAIAFARKLICWSKNNVANEITLLGLARAFFDLEIWVANDQDFLSEQGREALRGILARKKALLDLCFDSVRNDDINHAKFAMGYEIGREEIEKAIEPV
ncbi:hypothetical protein F5B20DRAFT_573325 [Whalleya microplaca]|nr:hypothetical protein F5B20DRAFT_573325 [Whalleya microplaca]